jgi:collagenase-like PrtC family protease
LTWGRQNYYAIEEPTSLNTLELLPQLMKMGVRAIKIEGRQRSPAYVAQVTKVWREAIDSCRDNPHRYSAKAGLDEWLGQGGRGPATHFGGLPQAVEMKLASH